MRTTNAMAAGFSLIEVLIALLVLSVGLLGLAALQANTLQFNQSAYLRSQATNLAYDMADRMRANREAALAGAYDEGFADPVPACGDAAAGTVVEQDIDAWRNSLICALPTGNGSIDVNGGVVTITVRWNEDRRPELLEAGESDELFVMTTGL